MCEVTDGRAADPERARWVLEPNSNGNGAYRSNRYRLHIDARELRSDKFFFIGRGRHWTPAFVQNWKCETDYVLRRRVATQASHA